MLSNTQCIAKGENINLIAVYFEITSSCNLNCKHCYNKKASKIEYTKDEIFRIINQIEKLNCKKIIISGGETFCSPYIWDIIEYCDLKKINLIIATNGILLTESVVNKLQNYKSYKLQISLDGTSEEENDNIRGKNSYKSVIEVLKRLKKNNIPVFIGYVLLNENSNHLEAFIRTMDNLGVKEIQFKCLVRSGNAIENYQQLHLSPEKFLKYIEEIREIFQNGKLSLNYALPNINSGCSLINEEKLDLIPRISSNGDVFVCQKFSSSIYCIGNIRKQELSVILDSLELSNIITLVNISKNYIKKCSRCNYSVICEKGCPAEILENGFTQYDDGYCSIKIQEILTID